MANPNRSTSVNDDLKGRYESMDTDRDTYISREEAATDQNLLERWLDFDSDADDRLNADEFGRYGAEAMANPNRLNAKIHDTDLKARFTTMDSDSDKFISRAEGSADKDLSDRWQVYDANADDQMDESEFTSFQNDGVTGFKGRSDPAASQDQRLIFQHGRSVSRPPGVCAVVTITAQIHRKRSIADPSPNAEFFSPGGLEIQPHLPGRNHM